jgi:hypothetical protein
MADVEGDSGLNNCRVCGYRSEIAPWGSDGRQPTFAICPCCECEWGYQDALPESARAYRATWLAAGAKWAGPDEQDGLTTEERLEHVPRAYQDRGPADVPIE